MSVQKRSIGADVWRALLIGCVSVVLGWSSLFASCAPTTTPGQDGSTKDAGLADTASADGKNTAKDDASPTDTGSPKDAGATEQGPVDTPATDDGTEPDKSTNSAVWYGQVQSIFQRNCEVCHNAKGVGPFALTNYDEVKAKSSVVEWSVKNKRMPPWMPSGNEQCEPFNHAIAMPQKDVDAVVGWIKAGMPKGDPKQATTYQPKQDKLDWVDADVDIQVDYTPPTKNPDDYHCFLTKKVTSEISVLRGFQLVPGVREMVHHVLIYGVSDAKAKQLEQQNKSSHWSCGTGALFGRGPTLLGVWVPGTDVVHFPKDTGMTMNANDRLVLEFHYNLSSLKGPKPDRTRIRLQFARQPVKYKLRLQLQAQFGIAIPPKTTGTEIKHTLSIPSPVRVWGIMPHMHKQGTKFSLKVQNPGQNKACMIDIPRWDYGWQQTFFFKQPGGLLLQGGEKILMTCTFDNPTTKTIGWGDRTGDEMCLNFYFVSTP